MRDWLAFAAGAILLLVLCLNACFYFGAHPIDFSAPAGIALIASKGDGRAPGGGVNRLLFLAWSGRSVPAAPPAIEPPAPVDNECPRNVWYREHGWYGVSADGTPHYGP